MKIAAGVWNGSASFHGRICEEILFERAITVSLKIWCILHPGDILALNEICGSFLGDSFGATMSPNRARLSSVLGT